MWASISGESMEKDVQENFWGELAHARSAIYPLLHAQEQVVRFIQHSSELVIRRDHGQIDRRSCRVTNSYLFKIGESRVISAY